MVRCRRCGIRFHGEIIFRARYAGSPIAMAAPIVPVPTAVDDVGAGGRKYLRLTELVIDPRTLAR